MPYTRRVLVKGKPHNMYLTNEEHKEHETTLGRKIAQMEFTRNEQELISSFNTICVPDRVYDSLLENNSVINAENIKASLVPVGTALENGVVDWLLGGYMTTLFVDANVKFCINNLEVLAA